MRAILTPFRVNELGVVLLKPGKEVAPLFYNRRVLVSTVPEFMQEFPSGQLGEAKQALLDDPALFNFLSNGKVLLAAGGKSGLEAWLMSQRGCQWHGDYHSHDETSLKTEDGALRLCFHHDNELREMSSIETVAEVARRNAAIWVIERVRLSFMLPEGHEVTLPELCWWAALNGVIDLMPESPARRVLKMPQAKVETGTLRESEIMPHRSATSVLEEAAKQVVELAIDPESPESYMLRPKRKRWENESYTRWVKSQPCLCCGKQADDPHHLIGYGLGGMATKAHDLFVIPLCRAHHDEIHADTRTFESKYGTQPELLLRALDRALAIGVIATGRKNNGRQDA
ncbi:DUF968 domain-containing protein [Erwinia pyri]|uniref:DUF968 domain-containing protein n=1 Tax=Erwinia pyri TaxID=3062598 RepID=A0AA50DJN2_9GAMM|nr:DUF968 domain-containing protein [Erwinia sp. DE2]WLS77235.1 DUF968 domain-containing protein [Erwinia sp. DE2]